MKRDLEEGGLVELEFIRELDFIDKFGFLRADCAWEETDVFGFGRFGIISWKDRRYWDGYLEFVYWYIEIASFVGRLYIHSLIYNSF